MSSLFISTIKDPKNLRNLCRVEQFKESTINYCRDYIQANLVILPKSLAYEFSLFCQRNNHVFPILETTDIGSALSVKLAMGANLTTDLPEYQLIDQGTVAAQLNNIEDLWSKNYVCFLLDDVFNYEPLWRQNHIPTRYREEGKYQPLYETNLALEETSNFKGKMTVTMQPMRKSQMLQLVKELSKANAPFQIPVHFGDPAEIGINSLHDTIEGEEVSIREDEIPVFWPASYSAIQILKSSKIEKAICNTYGSYFVTDVKS